MSEENKNKNMEDEVERAALAMKSAELLAANELYNDAVSRLYYALFYNMRALLFTLGLEPKTHEGMERLFSLHFVKTGLFETADAKFIAMLVKYRGTADYNSSFEFSKSDFNAFHKQANRLIQKIHSYLKL